jgi:signal transduction histidine kinase/ActR/RegA family two-component response regulator
MRLLVSDRVGRLLAPSLRTDPRQARRARMVVLVALAWLALIPAVGLVSLFQADSALAWIDLLIAAVFVAVLGVVRFSGSVRVAVHGMAAGITAGAAIYATFRGGWVPGLGIWLGLVPVMVHLLLGRGDGRPWIVGALLILGAVFGLDTLELLPPRVELPPAVWALNVGVFLFIALTFLRLYEASRDVVLEELRTASQAADEAKTAMLTHISHELRTPLHGLVGAAQLLASSDDVLERHELGALVKVSGDALAAIVRDVLDLSRLEAGAFGVVEQPFSPRDLVEGVAALSVTRAQTLGLEFTCDLSPEVPSWVLGDEGRVRQVLLNLVDNALKYTGEGSVRVSVDWDDDELRLRVEDTGVGIAEADQARVFEPFQRRADASGATTGLGLGLAICRRLVEALGGTLRLESAERQGCAFTLAVPAPVSQKPAAREMGADAVPRGLRVLLVEDDSVSRLVVARTLERTGHSCRAATTAIEGLAALDEEDFDVVLMDCRLPDISGLEATGRIRSRADARADVPVIALTANAIAGDEERCLAAGMNAYLTKPLDVEGLQAALARVLPVRPEIGAE